MKSIRSYAKINISLNVVGNREDGYHLLDTIMVPIELHDSIIISNYGKTIADNFVTVDDFSNGLIHYNLVSHAINKLTKKFSREDHFRVFIHKVIPMQAGLGGGSSNAAFTMKAVNNMLKLNASDEDLIEIGAPLGADIPFFVHCKPARCRGIGEEIEPIEIKNNYSVLIVKPDLGCSTKEVFAKFDVMGGKAADIDEVVKALKEGDDKTLAEHMGNMLEKAAVSIVPEIKEIEQYLRNSGVKLVMMSGSGSTVFALSTDKKLLKTIMKNIGERWFCALTRIIK